jgi:hypothetical protein
VLDAQARGWSVVSYRERVAFMLLFVLVTIAMVGSNFSFLVFPQCFQLSKDASINADLLYFFLFPAPFMVLTGHGNY